MNANSPPHRWLRKHKTIWDKEKMNSPPHRWLRNKLWLKVQKKNKFTTTQVA
ncbi:hypothetical protein [uncultured Gammaproteobacteria bacterium]|nr:hypothetical protein [uncultured Gammaproteobacteria bacterium]